MEKETVKQLQQYLINFGLVDPPVDGVLGRFTLNACKIFSEVYKCENTPDAVFTKIKNTNLPPIKPANKLTEKIVEEVYRKKFWLSRGVDAPNIIYIEGANLDGSINNNKINYWNDLRLILIVEHNGRAYIDKIWQSTVNSGRFYTNNPLRTEGAANIEIPLQIWAWKVGRHITRSLNEDALVQVLPIPVRRDRDKDGRDENDKLQDHEVIGLNQHSGQGELVDKWSAGCLVVNSPQAQREFMRIVRGHRSFMLTSDYIFSTILLLNDFLLDD